MPSNIDTILPSEHPGLASLLWNRDLTVPMAGADALSVYEANWRHLDQGALSASERLTIRALADRFGGGHLLVAGGFRWEA